MQQEANSKYIRMTTEPIPKLICTLAIPTIISMLVTALYNIADTFFVGQLGTEATAGVGLAQPTADLFAFTLALVLAVRMYRELLEKEKTEPKGPETNRMG